MPILGFGSSDKTEQVTATVADGQPDWFQITVWGITNGFECFGPNVILGATGSPLRSGFCTFDHPGAFPNTLVGHTDHSI